MRHYKQARKRGWSVPAESPAVGSRSGHGVFGVLDDDGSTVLCHECGRRLRSLGYHLSRAHGMTAVQYRAAHGLPRGLGLEASDLRELRSEQAKDRVGSTGWQRLEQARDPVAASRSRPVEALQPAPGVMPVKVKVSRANLPRVEARERTCPVCGAVYRGRARTCGRPGCVRQGRSEGAKRQAAARPRLSDEERRELQEASPEQLRVVVYRVMRRGVSSREIGQALGHGPQWMTKHFPRPD